MSGLIYLSFAQGNFPTILKTANVISIHRKGDKSKCDNYRPSKLLEQLEHEILYSFLEKEKLLFEEQYGFRNKCSTADALADITERIRDAYDKEYFAHGSFLVFRRLVRF